MSNAFKIKNVFVLGEKTNVNHGIENIDFSDAPTVHGKDL